MVESLISPPLTTTDRAKLSLGKSSGAIYRSVASLLGSRHTRGGTVLDVGCGCGDLQPFIAGLFDTYCGADVVRYQAFPEWATFYQTDLEADRIAVPDSFADAVVAVETIEHLENPRAFCRELTRLAKPDGWIVVTTPNQLSLLSKLTLALRNEFNAFRASSYPAHLTALLEVDLRRIAAECGWRDFAIHYTSFGRIPGSARHWPRWLANCFPRAFSDNVLAVGRKSHGVAQSHSNRNSHAAI